MNIDERIEALTMNLELMSHQIEEQSQQIREHSKQLAQDAEHIPALVRIAEMHERRVTDLKNGNA